jgi:hypothetical protein
MINKFDELWAQQVIITDANGNESNVTDILLNDKRTVTIAKTAGAPTGYSVLTLTDGSGFSVGADITGDGDNGNDGVGTVVAKNGSDICLVETTSGSWVATNGVDDASPYAADATTIASVDEVVTITITVKDGIGKADEAVHNLNVWLSDAATGLGAASTMIVDWFAAFEAAADTGIVLKEQTADALLSVQTNSQGIAKLLLSEAAPGASSAGYVCVENPANGQISTVQLVQADYV